MDVCTNYNFLSIMYIFKQMLNVVRVMVPVLIIVLGSFDFFKAVMASKDEDMAKLKKQFVTRLTAGIMVFLVPTLISFSLNIIGQSEMLDVKIANCFVSANPNKIKELENMADIERLKDIVKHEVKPAPSKPFAGTDFERSLLDYVGGWEGGLYYCDKTTKKEYIVRQDSGDRPGVYTVGPGVTNSLTTTAQKLGFHQYFPMQVGDCIPVGVVERVKLEYLRGVESTVNKELVNYGVKDWTPNEKIAMISFTYNLGPSRLPAVVKAYSSGGPSQMWSVLKKYINANGRPLEGLVKRRDDEYDVFVTGQLKDTFYSKTYCPHYGQKCSQVGK